MFLTGPFSGQCCTHLEVSAGHNTGLAQFRGVHLGFYVVSPTGETTENAGTTYNVYRKEGQLVYYLGRCALSLIENFH